MDSYMELASKFKTYQNALQFRSYLEDVKLGLSKDKRKSLTKVLEENESSLSVLVLEIIDSSEVDQSDTDAVIEFLSSLISKIEKLEKASLVIAVNPSDNLIRDISNWLYKEVSNDILLDIKVDPNILGGLKISYRGKYLDLSLNSKLEEVFKEKKVELK